MPRSDLRVVVSEATPIAAPDLQLGERAAIGHAIEIGAGLLADDAAARRHGKAGGLHVIGTLDVLVLAKRAALVSEIIPLIEQLRTGGQRLSHAAVAQALAAAGETQ